MIYHEKLPEFKMLTKEKIRMFVKMCTVVKYKAGDTIDLSSGGVCFKGGFKELGNDITEAEKSLKNIEFVQKKLDMKLKDAMKVNSSHDNKSYIASKK
jgi:hypothetical protein